MPQLSFRGGIHPLQKTHHGKGLTNQLPIREAEAPKLVAIPLVQHIGAPCAPCVSAGIRIHGAKDRPGGAATYPRRSTPRCPARWLPWSRVWWQAAQPRCVW